MTETDDNTEKPTEAVETDDEGNNPTPVLPPSAGSVNTKIAEQIGINLRQIGDVQIYDGTPENAAYDQAEQVAIIPESQRAGETADNNQDAPVSPIADETIESPDKDNAETPTDDGSEPANTEENEPRPTTPPISYRPLTTDRPPSISDMQEAWTFFKKMREEKK